MITQDQQCRWPPPAVRLLTGGRLCVAALEAGTGARVDLPQRRGPVAHAVQTNRVVCQEVCYLMIFNVTVVWSRDVNEAGECYRLHLIFGHRFIDWPSRK